MSVTPGKDIMEVTGGSGEVFAREGSSLMAGLKNSGFTVNAFQPILHQNSNGMKAGDPVADMFKGQHVTVEAKPNASIFGIVGEIVGGTAKVASGQDFKKPEAEFEVKRPPVPTAAAPKSSF
ncbi:MAG: hypothetical protein Q8K65_07475 [Alphaproteobacteria bacterium]|nr:hypothetical protein [Alphaproteobacteria bacterium]